MPTSADGWAVDTSVAVAALDAGHAAHGACAAVVRSRRPALAGHAVWETFSVLTRMPGQLAVDAPTAAAVIARTFPTVTWLAPDDADALLGRLQTIGIVGGAVYDALVGEAARSNGCRLLTRDLRARRTYDLLGVEHELVDA
ncbi:MAG: PIN domain-containing protein [Ilumatobacteraceae bacterium]|jgi:predicted nucleic acid-binding protein|nr:PIN domain-containing protein [Ilumatobacteraceae bacterium]